MHNGSMSLSLGLDLADVNSNSFYNFFVTAHKTPQWYDIWYANISTQTKESYVTQSHKFKKQWKRKYENRTMNTKKIHKTQGIHQVSPADEVHAVNDGNCMQNRWIDEFFESGLEEWRSNRWWKS